MVSKEMEEISERPVTATVLPAREVSWSTLGRRVDADTKAARTGEERASLCSRGSEVGTDEVVLGAAGRMCGVVNQPCARLTARLPVFEARRGCF